MKARDAALAAIHGFADELEKRLPSMVDFAPMGEANYNYYLKTCSPPAAERHSRWRCLGAPSWRVIARSKRCCPILRSPIRIRRAARTFRRIRRRS